LKQQQCALVAFSSRSRYNVKLNSTPDHQQLSISTLFHHMTQLQRSGALSFSAPAGAGPMVLIVWLELVI
jgi:hypothetical protein